MYRFIVYCLIIQRRKKLREHTNLHTILDTGYYVLFLTVKCAKSHFKSPPANDLIVTSSHYLKHYTAGAAPDISSLLVESTESVMKAVTTTYWSQTDDVNLVLGSEGPRHLCSYGLLSSFACNCVVKCKSRL